MHLSNKLLQSQQPHRPLRNQLKLKLNLLRLHLKKDRRSEEKKRENSELRSLSNPA